MNATLTLKAWGNSLGVRIPVRIAKEAHLKADSQVTIRVEDDRVVLTPVTPKRLSLAERLALYDVAVHGGEVMATPARGAEKW